jgi:replication factor C subunit 3/5
MLWVDRHRPKKLEDVELHPEVTNLLTHLADSGDMPHLLFYGPSGSGKKTRVMALLHRIYGPNVFNIKLEHKSMQVTDSKTIDFTTLSSPYHIDMNPSDAGNYDRVVVMELIREIAQTAPMVSSGTLHTGVSSAKKGDQGGTVANLPKFKVIVLNEVEKMSRGAQQALRRTMEKYVNTCRLILITSSTSRLIAPLRSRCIGVRVAAHGLENTTQAVRRVCMEENLAVPSTTFLSTLHHRSNGNLRRALLMLEAAKMNRCDMGGTGLDIPRPDWLLFIEEIVSDIIKEQTPKKLHDIRIKYYELMSQCVPGEVLMQSLVDGLMMAVDPSLRRDIVSAAAQYDHQMKLGTKPIVHLEAFTATVMKLLKTNAITAL